MLSQHGSFPNPNSLDALLAKLPLGTRERVEGLAIASMCDAQAFDPGMSLSLLREIGDDRMFCTLMDIITDEGTREECRKAFGRSMTMF